MAPRDIGGVVDPQLKVYGTKNLRVCDASIIPLQLGATPMSTVYAIAEKVPCSVLSFILLYQSSCGFSQAADMIKAAL